MTEKDEFEKLLDELSMGSNGITEQYKSYIDFDKMSEVRFEKLVFNSSLYHLEEIIKENEAKSSPPDLSWPYWLMPGVKVDDAIASLEEIYAEKILSKACKGDKKRADRLFHWQVCLIVLGHHAGKIKAVVGGAAAYLGLGKLLDVLKL